MGIYESFRKKSSKDVTVFNVNVGMLPNIMWIFVCADDYKCDSYYSQNGDSCNQLYACFIWWNILVSQLFDKMCTRKMICKSF